MLSLKTFCILSVWAFEVKAHWNFIAVSQWYLIFNIYSIKAGSFANSIKPCIVCGSPSWLIIMDSSSPKGQILPPLYESNLSNILEKTFF